MKAILVRETGGPEVLRLEEVPDPSPGPGQVVVRVVAAGVNPVDTYLRAATHGYRPTLPFIPGLDAAGTVVGLGPDVAGLAPGDRVYTAGTISGAYAEFALCAADRVYPLPERVPFLQGAAVGVPGGAAYRALFQRARARAGETVLVHGATGGVGLVAVQLARAAGLHVIGSAGDGDSRRVVLEAGAHHVVDHGSPDHLGQALELAGSRGVDVVLEMLANVHLGKDLEALAQGGRVVVIGSRGPVEIDPRAAMVREAAVLGMMLTAATDDERREIYAGLTAAMESGALTPVVHHELPLAEAAEAHHDVETGTGYGKVVLTP